MFPQASRMVQTEKSNDSMNAIEVKMAWIYSVQYKNCVYEMIICIMNLHVAQLDRLIFFSQKNETWKTIAINVVSIQIKIAKKMSDYIYTNKIVYKKWVIGINEDDLSVVFIVYLLQTN